jgi:hypothetical protein
MKQRASGMGSFAPLRMTGKWRHFVVILNEAKNLIPLALDLDRNAGAVWSLRL